MNKSIRTHAIIKGRVQGVCFRMETQRQADKLGVLGWVRNLPNGNVEAVFEGDENVVNSIVEWCHNGPPSASVDKVETHDEKYTGDFSSFIITR